MIDPPWAGREPLPKPPALWALWKDKTLVATGVGDPDDEAERAYLKAKGWQEV